MKSKTEIIKQAKDAGSAATTLRGAVKFLIKHHRTPAEILPLRLETTESWQRAECTYDSTRSGYLNSEKVRCADSEAKRARDDVKFRARWLRKLRAEERRIQNPKQRTIDEITQAHETLAGRRVRACEIARLKTIALRRRVNPSVIPETFMGTTVDSFDAELARRHGANIDMRGYDAELIASRRNYGQHSGGETTWRNGRPVSYERATHNNYVRSLALIRSADPRLVDYVFVDTRVTVTLPDGFRWDADVNGLRAISGPDDYHPSVKELLQRDASAKIVAALRERAETRKRLAAEREAEAAEVAGVFVCVADSLRAGNCLVGTKNFAARHSLDTHRHYHAPEILQLANGDIGRVRLAIKAACIRDHQERERGYALLSEHQCA